MTKVNNNLLNVLPSDDILSQCIHCGMCLATCPTYDLTKLERSSPRGRIKMIKSVARGEMEISEIFADEMNFCLDCQACETVCPAGVKYGSMVEAARVEIDNSGHGSFLKKSLKKFALKYIVSSKRNLKIAARLLYYYQNSFLSNIVNSLCRLKILPFRIIELQKLSPKVSKEFSDSNINEITEANSEQKYITAFHYGCLMNVMFADINSDTVQLLSKTGNKVITPKNQQCCGSLHAHNGDFETAKKLAKENLRVFSKYNYDYLVSNSAGCGAFMKEYHHLFEDDLELKGIAKDFSERVIDLSEFYSDILPFEFKTSDENFTYHDACHLVHSQKIFAQPRKILLSVSSKEYKDLEESSWCCGSAGIYNIIRFEDSMKFLERKINNIKKSGAEKVITSNPGCISQIEYGCRKNNLDITVEHLATFLNRSLK
ncbi:MAG TPA: (Fe-S)-binding protein [Ignavibacteriaceae bacterium]|nr:(Fe-S)-binding protein [Ignavibacteriaceae bacterium]